MDKLLLISKAEREIQAAKFRVKDLQAKAWQKPNNQRDDFAPEIQKAQTELETARKKLAQLIVGYYYNLDLDLAL